MPSRKRPTRPGLTPEICPTCGAEVPARAPACPECGADETTGWSDRARQDDLGLPDDTFDYEQFVREEFGGGNSHRQTHPLRRLLILAGALLLLLAALVATFLAVGR